MQRNHITFGGCLKGSSLFLGFGFRFVPLGAPGPEFDIEDTRAGVWGDVVDDICKLLAKTLRDVAVDARRRAGHLNPENDRRIGSQRDIGDLVPADAIRGLAYGHEQDMDIICRALCYLRKDIRDALDEL